MSGRLKKPLIVGLAGLLLLGASQVQDSMNRDREALNLTRAQPLENAPPVLAFTTIALGGFRGLISNLLWARAADLQESGKFFEMAQLAEWITKLEPHYTQVWIYQAWNLGWNISVKFKDYSDRWRWVRRGMTLLRDEALRYNPNEILLYRELAWFFQDKMGKGTDDASTYYKWQWANEMSQLFSGPTPDFDALIRPVTEDQRARAQLLRDGYKLDPRLMKTVDERYGPLDWRLPEAHAIYWASLGFDFATANPGRVNRKDFITLRRVIYQSMLMSFQRGRLEMNRFTQAPEFGPNLDIIPRVSEAYEANMGENDAYRGDIQRAHWYFLRQASYFLYVNNRTADAARWYKYLGDHYPDRKLLNSPNSFPRFVSLDQFAVASVQEDLNDQTPDRVKSALEGLIGNSYRCLILDEDDRAAGFKLLARKVYETYESAVPANRKQAIGLGPFDAVNQRVLDRLLDPDHGLAPEPRAVLRTKLNLPQEPAPANPAPAPPATKPAPPPAAAEK